MVDRRSTYTIATAPAWVLVLGGVTSLFGGAVGVLSALDIIPTPDSHFGAPRWMVAMLCTSFVAVGVMLLARLVARTSPAARNAARSVAAASTTGVVLTFTTGTAAFLTWAALTGARGRSRMSLFGVVLPLADWADRAVERTLVALAALIMDGAAVAVWYVTLKRLGRRSAS